MYLSDPSAKHRVAVIGAGIIGTMSAWQLAARGHAVTVYDQFDTPNDRGASAGESRIFRTIYKEGPAYLPILSTVRDLWNELQPRTRPFLEMCGGLTIGPADYPDIRAVIDCAEAGSLDYLVLSPAEMSRRFPQHRLDSDEIGVFDPAAGIFRPELAVIAARRAGLRHGAEYCRHTRVLGLRAQASGVVVDTADGATTFDAVVLATGPWCNELSGLPRTTVAPRRLAALWFAADPVLHSPARMPIAIRRHTSGGFSCFPAVDGVGVKVLPHHLPWPELPDPAALPRSIDTETIRSVQQAVAQLLPGLDPAPYRTGTWAEGFAADHAPIVGVSPEDSRIIYAFGMSGQGFKFSPMVGRITADLVTDGHSEALPDIMNAARLCPAPAAGAS